MRLSFSLLAALAVVFAASDAASTVDQTRVSPVSSPNQVRSIDGVQSRFLRTPTTSEDTDEEERGWEMAASKLAKSKSLNNIDDATKLAKSPSFQQLDDELVGLMAKLEYTNLQNNEIFKQLVAQGVTPKHVSKELKIADKLATTKKIAQLREDGDFMMWAQYSKYWSDARKNLPKL